MLYRLLFICFSVILMSACTGNSIKRNPTTEVHDNLTLSRPDPGYLHYLSKKTMLYKADELSKLLTASGLNWRYNAAKTNFYGLLKNCNTWLEVHPQTLVTSNNVNALQQLSYPVLWANLKNTHLKGLYISPVNSSGKDWDIKHSLSYSAKEDVVSIELDPQLGSDNQYKLIAEQSYINRGAVGSNITPAATGIGPDFFLAARDFREYSGIYHLIEVPTKLWKFLPSIEQEWEVVALNPEQIQNLSSQGALPRKVRQDEILFLENSGWACTGQIRCADGNMRRWLFRYYWQEKIVVLNWADPNATARKILNASIISQVGQAKNNLAGFSIEAFIALSPAINDNEVEFENYDYNLALEVALNLSTSIRSIGGTSWLKDELPLPIVASMLNNAADFIADPIFNPALEHALLSGNTELVNFLIDEAFLNKIDFRRLVHNSTAYHGLDYKLSHLRYLEQTEASKGALAQKLYLKTLAEAEALTHGKVKAQTQKALQAKRIYFTTPAGIAAQALGLSDYNKLSFEEAQKIRQGHELLIFAKAMQPGILMLSSQDLVGLLPVFKNSNSGEAETAAQIEEINTTAHDATELAEVETKTSENEAAESIASNGVEEGAANTDEAEHQEANSSTPQNNTGAQAITVDFEAITKENLNIPALKDYASLTAKAESTEDLWDERLSNLILHPLLSSLENSRFNPHGLPRGVSLYGPLDVQHFIDDSFMRQLNQLLTLREQFKLAESQLLCRLELKSQGLFALVMQNQKGQIIISIANFSQKTAQEDINLAEVPELKDILDNTRKLQIVYGELKPQKYNYPVLNLSMDGWDKALLVLE